MKLPPLWVQRKHKLFPCSTPSPLVTQSRRLLGKAKRQPSKTWRSFNAVTEVFARLVTRPTSLDNICMSVLESYVVLMYDRGSDETTVDSARKHMFTSKARSIDAIPPTRAALLQHARRATYQGGHVWGQAQVRDPDLPSPESWGWNKNPTRGWEPMWTLLPEAAVSCSELLRCGCKKGCRGLCKCVKANHTRIMVLGVVLIMSLSCILYIC